MTIIKTLLCCLQVAALGVAVAFGPALRANTIPVQTRGGSEMNHGSLQLVAFSDSAEARALRRAYIILASGDHDYDGHRGEAMKRVKKAADLLGLDLSGDLHDRERQVLSDDKMREAKGLILQVLGAAEVKDQKRVTKDLNEAVNQINKALGVR